MKLKDFFKLGSLDKLAKLVKRSVSTIQRWKREGIPERSKTVIKKLVEKKKKPTKKKPVKKKLFSTVVPLTAREKRQQREQKRLALEEKKRLNLLIVGDRWVKEYFLQPYTQNRVVAIYNAIERNKKRILGAGPKEKKRIKLAMKIARQMLLDYLDGAEYINPEITQPLIDAYNIDEEEAFKDIYGYV